MLCKPFSPLGNTGKKRVKEENSDVCYKLQFLKKCFLEQQRSCNCSHLTPNTWAWLYLMTGRGCLLRGVLPAEAGIGFKLPLRLQLLWPHSLTSLTQCCIESLEIRLQMSCYYHNITWRKAALLGIVGAAAFLLECLQMDLESEGNKHVFALELAYC